MGSAWSEMRVRVPSHLHAEHKRRATAAGLTLSQQHRRVLEVALLSTPEVAALGEEVGALREQIRAMSRDRDELRGSLLIVTRDRDRLRRRVSNLLPYAALGRSVAAAINSIKLPTLVYEEAESPADALRERLEEQAAEASVSPPWIRTTGG